MAQGTTLKKSAKMGKISHKKGSLTKKQKVYQAPKKTALVHQTKLQKVQQQDNQVAHE